MSRFLSRVRRSRPGHRAKNSHARLSATTLANVSVPKSSTASTRAYTDCLFSIVEGPRPVDSIKVESNDIDICLQNPRGGSPIGTPLRPKCNTQSHSPLACRFHSRQVTDSRSCPSGRPITRPTFHTRARPSSSSTSADTSVTTLFVLSLPQTRKTARIGTFHAKIGLKVLQVHQLHERVISSRCEGRIAMLLHALVRSSG